MGADMDEQGNNVAHGIGIPIAEGDGPAVWNEPPEPHLIGDAILNQ
jgi:hypothetical protein